MIQPLGKTQLASRAAALALFDTFVGMGQRCDSSQEEAALRREGYDLTIAMRVDEIGANEENIQTMCTALTQSSAMIVFGHDEDSFWLEITVPDVFEADDFDPVKAQTSVLGEKRASVGVDEPPPGWLTKALQEAKEDRGQLVFEDFIIDKQRFFVLADLYGAFKRAATDIAAEFVFQPPNLPANEHGSAYLVAEKLTLRKADMQPLLPLIAQASSFGVSYCADNRVRLGVEVSDIYNRRI